jgi:1,4-dihydroxy-6-naphthoate synthase
MSLSRAISTCPNDTFMFHQFIEREAFPTIGDRYEVTLLDIQELNVRMDREEFDFCKVSSVQAIRRRDVYAVCDAGASLGFGVGPLLLRRKGVPALHADSKVLCPGIGTTASALFTSFYPSLGSIEHVVFSEIMPALSSGEADYGVVIHEGRFTYQEFGLELVADLGELWEKRFALPLPLGCIVAHKRVPSEVVAVFETSLRESIAFAYGHREAAFGVMQRYAQELRPEAIWAHVDLYVNRWSTSLGEEGARAFAELTQLYGGI